MNLQNFDVLDISKPLIVFTYALPSLVSECSFIFVKMAPVSQYSCVVLNSSTFITLYHFLHSFSSVVVGAANSCLAVEAKPASPKAITSCLPELSSKDLKKLSEELFLFE